MNKSFYPFLFIVLAIFIALTAADLLADGMFMDGLIYAAVAKNLAQGEGSFWFLHFSDTYMSAFHEHPPLVFGIQSVFYQIFGDSILVEKLFSFSTYIISGSLLLLIWQKITNKKFSSISWLPLLLWISIPLVPWAAVNNMLENTMLIFVCLSVLFILKSQAGKRYLYLPLSGLMLFFAFLSKGFTGLFPLSLPFWIWCFQGGSLKTLFLDMLLLLIGLFVPLVFIYFFNPEAIISIQAYLDIQVFKSISEAQTVNTRFYILGKLFTELLIPLGMVLVVFLFGKKEKIENRQWIYILLALGLSGVLPIMVSMKQNGFYILCALPFFVLALALIIAERVNLWVNKIDVKRKGFKIFRILSIFFLLVSMTVSLLQKGKRHQHKTLIHSVSTVANFVPRQSIISVPYKFHDHWSMHAYFQRYADISLEADDEFKREYLFLERKDPLPSDYQNLHLQILEFTLCRRIKK